jgi:DNA-binding transcriptional regulator YhcF (GntR family)
MDRLPLNRDSPVPLYHQLAEALRWRISTGRLAGGERLPAVRDAAREIGVHMHTVRRAYALLAEDGLVESAGGRGTFVLGAAAAAPPEGEIERFVDAVVNQAEERFGLGPGELARRLTARGDGRPALPVVHVLECSESQCLDHAAELAAAWRIDARPWPLDRAGEPPAGPLVATYFHYAEILRRWPARRGDLCFLPIHVDPGLPHRLANADRLVACETDEDRTRNLQSDLAALFPPETVPIAAHVSAAPGDALDATGRGELCCFAPRAWARLTSDQQNHPRARKVRYVVEPDALAALGRRLGWAPAAGGGSDTPDRRTSR